jgi:hypothetical protein
MKKFLIAAVAALALATVATTASAQHRGGGGGGGGGGGWHGSSGGGWHGGGWHGHDGHSHFVVGIGFPYYWPYYYPYGYYGAYYPYGYGYYGYPYYDGYSYDSGAPQTYIQRDSGDTFAPAAPPQRSQYSYYCTDPAGYFPQIANCPSGWLTVVPNGAPHAAPTH